MGWSDFETIDLIDRCNILISAAIATLSKVIQICKKLHMSIAPTLICSPAMSDAAFTNPETQF